MIESRIPCVCCGYLTIPVSEGEGSFFTCPVCMWEDDELQSGDPDLSGGANKMSLNEARRNFRSIGAKGMDSLRHVRAPLPAEKPQ